MTYIDENIAINAGGELVPPSFTGATRRVWKTVEITPDPHEPGVLYLLQELIGTWVKGNDISYPHADRAVYEPAGDPVTTRVNRVKYQSNGSLQHKPKIQTSAQMHWGFMEPNDQELVYAKDNEDQVSALSAMVFAAVSSSPLESKDDVTVDGVDFDRAAKKLFNQGLRAPTPAVQAATERRRWAAKK